MSHAKELTDQLNEFHLYDNVYDDALDIFIYETYADTLKKKRNLDWSVPYFSPSSADKCPRELYAKAKRLKKDPHVWQPHQRRWVQFGEVSQEYFRESLCYLTDTSRNLQEETPNTQWV